MFKTALKVYVVTPGDSVLAEPAPDIALKTLAVLEETGRAVRCGSVAESDLLLLEQPWAYRGRQFVKQLLQDLFVIRYCHKIFVINLDDRACGLLPGLYMNIGSRSFTASLHRAMPYWSPPNPRDEKYVPEPLSFGFYLASWRGNTISHAIRRHLVSLYRGSEQIICETTDSWLNHPSDEKARYVHLMTKSAFSLCPSGWGPATFRIYESMSAGRCPVIIADEFVPVVGFDWNSFSIQVPEAEISHLPALLQSRLTDAEKLGREARRVWESWFSPSAVARLYAQQLVELWEAFKVSRPRNGPDRWKSAKTWRQNGWQLDQRIRCRIKNVLSVI